MSNTKWIPKDNKPDNMPDDIWETYYITTTGLNNFNVCEKDMVEAAKKGIAIMGPYALQRYALEFEKAQRIIQMLLEETGRNKRYSDWGKENGTD